MPDRSKYPAGFDPNYFHHPGQWATAPSEQIEKVEDLASEEASCDILLCLADILQDHPAATHINLEKVSGREASDDTIKATIQRRTQHPNLDYAAELNRYQARQVELARAKAEWEANSQRWKQEVASEKDTADYKVYLGLKARFEGRS